MSEPCVTEEESEPVLSELVVITGMSGAGRSEAIHTFEDMGYFCIDNLPPSFIRQVVDLTALPGSRIRRIAIVCDVRGREFFGQLAAELQRLEDSDTPYHLLFLEADDETLVRRFSETRRRHPLGNEDGSLIERIHIEREALSGVRGTADLIVDTTLLSPQQLRFAIKERFFGEDPVSALSVAVTSFGFKYGIPIDADIVMDVRFLPNPYYSSELRSLTGLDEPVKEFVFARDETAEFVSHWRALLGAVMPGYLMEGKSRLGIALGCTGGQHRSVALAEDTACFLRDLGYAVTVGHRDITRDRESA